MRQFLDKRKLSAAFQQKKRITKKIEVVIYKCHYTLYYIYMITELTKQKAHTNSIYIQNTIHIYTKSNSIFL